MSAKVATQKFSFPFSCAARLSQQDEKSQMGCIQVKTLTLQDLHEQKQSSAAVKGAQAHNEIQAQESPNLPPDGDTAATRVLVCSEASQGIKPSRQSVVQKLTVDNEDQRPAAKRQLSSESAARTITVVKKSAVRDEAEDQTKPKAHLKQRAWPCAGGAGKRKRRKDLFTNSEVFHRVDSHVIRTGAEVTKQSMVL